MKLGSLLKGRSEYKTTWRNYPSLRKVTHDEINKSICHRLRGVCIPISDAIAQSTNQEILVFANGICDQISTSGSLSRQEIEAKISGKISGVAKLLGASVGADGNLKTEDQTYEGLPYDSLPTQMTDARNCRKEIAKMLISERQRISDNKQPIYLECRRKEFGVERWASMEEVSRSSGWRKGGYNQESWCQDVISWAVSTRNVGQHYKHDRLDQGENAKWGGTFGRTRYYNYFCKIRLKWNPVYAQKQAPACGVESR